MKRYAVRNIRLCTKDCICLYVCPTGATDTENSIIDRSKCIGCGACANACPSKAISMVPCEFPAQQPKTQQVKEACAVLIRNKTNEESIAEYIAKTTDNPNEKKLMEGLAKSSRLVSEDMLREAGYMLPQSKNVQELLKDLIENPPMDDFPKEAAKAILDLIPCNE